MTTNIGLCYACIHSSSHLLPAKPPESEFALSQALQVWRHVKVCQALYPLLILQSATSKLLEGR